MVDMEHWEQRPVWSMSGSEMLTALDTVHADISRLQTYRLELLAALDANGHAAEFGARDTAHLISTRHRLDPTDVRRDLRLATALPKYDTVRASLSPFTPSDPGSTAPLHPGQAEAIVTALERIPTTARVPVENLKVAEQELVKAAHVLSPADLRRLGKRVRDTLDTDGPEPAEARALAAETLWLKRGDLGTEFGGYLAGANAELLHTLILAGAKPHKTVDGHRDPRSRGKRQADALTTILTTAAATGTAAPSHGDIKPHVTVTIALNDLATATGTGTLASGTTLSAGAIRRLACDAGLIPIVLGTDSEPLDVGTHHRFVTRPIRHALNARDKGCIICTAPPAMCEAHHIVHWANGGPTALTNLALLCRPHHTDVHQGHYTLTTHNGRPHYTRPGWADPPPAHPRPSSDDSLPTSASLTHPSPSRASRQVAPARPSTGQVVLGRPSGGQIPLAGAPNGVVAPARASSALATSAGASSGLATSAGASVEEVAPGGRSGGRTAPVGSSSGHVVFTRASVGQVASADQVVLGGRSGGLVAPARSSGGEVASAGGLGGLVAKACLPGGPASVAPVAPAQAATAQGSRAQASPTSRPPPTLAGDRLTHGSAQA